jgi:hypothetical protein
MISRINLLIPLFVLIGCVSSQKIKSTEPVSSKIIEEDPRIKKVDLSSALNEMNDTSKIDLEDMAERKKQNRDDKSITQYIVGKLSDLQYDYMKALRENPAIKGKVTVEIRIISDGSVDTCFVCDTHIEDIDFLHSILKRIKRWNFGITDIPNDTTIIKYPIVFSQ